LEDEATSLAKGVQKEKYSGNYSRVVRRRAFGSFLKRKRVLIEYSVRSFKKPLLILLPILFTALLLILLLGGKKKPLDARLATPALLAHDILQAERPVFVTPEFLPFFPSTQKFLLPTSREAEAAARDKTFFWKLHREHHYSALLLGSSSVWSPLRDDLLSSPLWTLTDVSPWGYLLKPKMPEVKDSSPVWQVPTEKELQERWPDKNDRALFMILTAANLAAIHYFSEAEQLLTMAVTTKRQTSLLLSTEASLAASRGHWEEALNFAKNSRHHDRSNKAAQEILIRALIETGHTDEALEQARDLIGEESEDEVSLFLMARAAGAANSQEEEIKALARLVLMARKHGQPLGASLTYLGQAYAKSGERGEALRTFQQALLAPELSDEERKVLREIMDHLMEGNRSSSTLPPLKIPL
jgi:hypothetical protein